MSRDHGIHKPHFLSGTDDPGRPVALSSTEHEVLRAGLGAAVVPVLNRAAADLKQRAMAIVQVEWLGGMASLHASCPPIVVKLRFQIHETFAVLPSREPVFWMSTIYCGSELLAGKPGRLTGFDDPAVLERIAQTFVEDTVAAWRLRVANPVVSQPVPAVMIPLTSTRTRPREGCRGWTRHLPELRLPPGLPDREPVEVIASKWSKVRVRDSSGKEWELTHWQVDCGFQYIGANGSRLSESHPAIQATIRNIVWDILGERCSGKKRRRDPARVRYLLWVLQRNGTDISEFDEALADLE